MINLRRYLILFAVLYSIVPPSTAAAACPCTLWSPSTTPGTVDPGDPNSVEVGVRIRADVAGFITGVRFYKSAANTGNHIGSVWTNTGTLLASATFAGESSSGWQEADFSVPVLISANTTYVVSYYDPNGHYSFDSNFFATASFNNPPLHALQDGLDGLNGNYSLGHAFPVNGFQSSNFWVDAVFVPENTTSIPSVFSSSPANNATGVSIGTSVTVVFAQPMNASTINGTTFQLLDSSNNPVPGSVTYSPATQVATFTPTLVLGWASTYTANVQGGPTGVLDSNGNAMSSSYTWSFTTQPAPPNRGPGGPILVISNVVNPFTQYFSEILTTEGLNEYTITDISQVTSATLANYDVVILGDMPLSSSEVSLLSNWVVGGGNLIAMHPDSQLAGLLGLIPLSSTLSNAYILVQTTAGPGVGIVGETMQFHGSADLYSTNGASTIASLYSDAVTSTTYPAVTVNSFGAGQAAAFTYDLARSVIYTRQGNPAWSGEARDGQSLIRSDDLFFGAASFDPQLDWVDLTKVSIPQADEQQRLLANLILQMNAAKKPLPRFWYFPSGFEAVVVMTGDDHGSFYSGSATAQRFNDFIADSPAGCSVADWQCVRATSYLFPQDLASTTFTNSQAASYITQGFEIALHGDSSPTCSNWTTSGQLDSFYVSELSSFASQFPSVPAPQTHRMHCVSWSDYDSQPNVELNHGIRLDTTYYYWPPSWLNNQPGMFTGSGFPMRYTDRNGNVIDVYQAPTQMTDESGQTYPFNIDTLLDNAVGATGFYGAFTANMHNDSGTYPGPGANQIVASAQARGVPVVSALQMLTWLDGRNSSSFGSLSWNGSTLSFTIAVGTGAKNLQAMVPTSSGAGLLTSISLNGTPIAFTTQTIKGVQYAFFRASVGSYQATYATSGGPVTLSSLTLSPTIVTGGNSSTGTVTLSGAAPTGGASVTLSSGDPSAQVGSSVTVAAGATSATFSVTTSAVVASTPVTISGTFGTTRTATLTVNPTTVTLASVTLNLTSVTGGNGSTGTVTLSGAAPTGGAVVTLSSSDPSAQVGSSVTVGAGATGATFGVTTTPVASSTPVTISASYGTTQTVILTVNPPTLSSLTLSPATVVGGSSSTGTVTLSGAAPASGVIVTLQSSNLSAAQVLATVTVAGGSTSATFTISTTPVAANTSSVISATFGITKTATLNVNAATFSGLSLSPATLVGGGKSTGTVTLSGKAPAGGGVISVQSNNTAVAQVPASGTVTIPAGSTSATFTITTTPVAASTSAVISGTYGTTTRNATLNVNPASLISLTLNPNTVTGGTSTTGILTLNGAAPPSGAVVSLSSSKTTIAQVPTAATIPAGQTSTTFVVTTSRVHQTSAKISGTYRGTTRSDMLKVR